MPNNHPIFEQGRINGYQSVRSRAAPEMKAVAGRTYARLKSVERGRRCGLSLRPMRHGLAIVGVLLMLAGAYLMGPWGPLFTLLPLLWLALISIVTPSSLPPLSATARGRI